jgi:hypothetical protein
LALLEPAVADGQRHDLRLADHRYRIEVEAAKGLAHRQPGFSQVPLNAAATAISDLMLGQCR